MAPGGQQMVSDPRFVQDQQIGMRNLAIFVCWTVVCSCVQSVCQRVLHPYQLRVAAVMTMLPAFVTTC